MAAIRPLNAFNNLLKSKAFYKYIYEPARLNPAKFAASAALISVLTKDAFNCYYYVTQSLNNKEIPEEKRKFVAALDLFNGVSNVLLQATIGKWVEKNLDGWFENSVGKKLDKLKTERIARDLGKMINKGNSEPVISFERIEKHLRDNKLLGLDGKKAKVLKIGFHVLIILIATQVITKRIFTPLLATPLAGWFKDKFMNKKGKKDEKKPEEKLLEANYKPWLTKTDDNDNNVRKSILDKAA